MALFGLPLHYVLKRKFDKQNTGTREQSADRTNGSTISRMYRAGSGNISYYIDGGIWEHLGDRDLMVFLPFP